MNQMLKQVQKMQAEMQATQEALATETVEASVGGGVVKATVTGMGTLASVTIDPSAVDPDDVEDRKSTRLNSSHSQISYAVFCLKKKNISVRTTSPDVRRRAEMLSSRTIAFTFPLMRDSTSMCQRLLIYDCPVMSCALRTSSQHT